MNPYKILGIPFNATVEDIKERFRNLSKKYHPDVSQEPDVDYVEIIQAYKVLVDDEKREEYNKIFMKELLKKKIKNSNHSASLFILPNDRIEYSVSLENILKQGFRVGKTFNHNDVVDHLGQDIVIYIKPFEVKLGAAAILELPAKLPCPVCRGSNPTCYRCKGSGFVKTVEKVCFFIPQSVKDGETMEFNPRDYYPVDNKKWKSLINFKSKNIILKIVFIDNL